MSFASRAFSFKTFLHLGYKAVLRGGGNNCKQMETFFFFKNKFIHCKVEIQVKYCLSIEYLISIINAGTFKFVDKSLNWVWSKWNQMNQTSAYDGDWRSLLDPEIHNCSGFCIILGARRWYNEQPDKNWKQVYKSFTTEKMPFIFQWS